MKGQHVTAPAACQPQIAPFLGWGRKSAFDKASSIGGRDGSPSRPRLATFHVVASARRLCQKLICALGVIEAGATRISAVDHGRIDRSVEISAFFVIAGPIAPR